MKCGWSVAGAMLCAALLLGTGCCGRNGSEHGDKHSGSTRGSRISRNKADEAAELERMIQEYQREEMAKNAVGTLASDFELATSDESVHCLYDLRGNNVLIVFYRPDCGHCKAEIEELTASVQLRQLTTEGRLKVVTVDVCGDKTSWRARVQQAGEMEQKQQSQLASETARVQQSSKQLQSQQASETTRMQLASETARMQQSSKQLQGQQASAALPTGWTDAIIASESFIEDRPYALQEFPSMYLISPDGLVIFKDETNADSAVAAVVSALCK